VSEEGDDERFQLGNPVIETMTVENCYNLKIRMHSLLFPSKPLVSRLYTAHASLLGLSPLILRMPKQFLDSYNCQNSRFLLSRIEIVAKSVVGFSLRHRLLRWIAYAVNLISLALPSHQ
jgi:hypothetical protein